jgi:uncharacterized protein (TIGR03435 family)
MILGPLSCPALAAPPPQRSFEVATIKPSDPKNTPPESVDISPDRFQAVGMTLKELIKVAWDLNYAANDQVAGGPPWVSTTRYDLDAKEDAALAAELSKLSDHQQGVEIRAMLRDLITQRFSLRIHHETRQLAVYDLSIAKGGPRLLPAPDPAPKPDSPQEKPHRWIRFAGVGRLEGFGADTSTLITVLSMQPEIGGRLVLDKTGLTGIYDFTLKWTPDILLNASQAAANTDPSLFTALQEELGLRLDPAKAPVDRIVIDSVSPPIGN